MGNCAKCSAELIGSAKFCAACGAPVNPPSADHRPSANVSAAAPASPSSNVNVVSVPAGVAPNASVNPFAVTASPSTPDPFAATAPPSLSASPRERVEDETKRSASKPPLVEGAQPSHVSPLAVSNAISQRDAFQHVIGNAIEKERPSVAPPPPPARPKKPGTQLMPGAPHRLPTPGEPIVPSQLPAQEAAAAKKAPPRTVAMDFGGKLPGAPSAGASPHAATPSTPQNIESTTQGSGPMQPASAVATSGSAPSIHPGAMQPPAATAQPGSAMHQPPSAMHQPPSAMHQPPSAVHQPPSAVHQPPSAMHQPPSAMHQPPNAAMGQPPMAQPGVPYNAPYAQPSPYAQQQPAGAAGWGYPAHAMGQPPQAAAYPYSFGYMPGSRVQVTWSNGQRYPATVSQVSGSQCLVVFPDGQQHWVDMQYLSPG